MGRPNVRGKWFSCQPAFVLVVFFVLVLAGCIDDASYDPLTREERAWLSEHDGKIRLAHDPDAKPIDYLDKEGRFQGLAADYVRLIENHLNFKFDILHLKTWDEVLEKAKTKDIDVLCAFSKSQERSQYMLFTEPYITIPVVVLARDDFKGNLDLDIAKNLTITFTKGWVVDDYLRENYSHFNMLPAIDSDGALNNLITKKADAWVTALTVASTKIEANRVTNIRIAGKTDLSFNLSFASRNDWPILHHILEKGLARISHDERETIFGRWIHIDRQSIFESRHFWITVSVILGLSMLFGIIIFTWNRTLKLKIEEKTNALESEFFERIRAENALRKSQSLFTQMIEHSTTSMCLFNPDGTVNRVNNEFCTMFGVQEKVIKAAGYNVFKDQATIEAGLIPLLKNIFYEKKTEKWEVNFDIDLASKSTGTPTSKTGKICLEVVGYPVLNQKGDLDYVVLQYYDISKQKKDEADLYEGRTRLKAALDSMSDAVFISDATGHFIEFNDAFATFHRLKDKQACMKALEDWPKLIDVYMPDGTLAPLSQWAVSRALQGETGIGAEYTLRRKDTGQTWIGSYNFAPIYDPDGRIMGSVVVGRDITEQKRVVDEIKRQKRLFETMFNTIPDGIVITDTRRVIQLANKGMESTFGYKPDDLVNKTTKILYADVDKFQQTGQTVFDDKARKPEDLYITRYKDCSGREFSGETFGAKLFDENNQWIGNLGIMRDITERERHEKELKAIERKLNQAQKMESIGTLAGGIAHDFNNILFPILGYTEMLLEDVTEDSPFRESLHEIYTGALRARDLVQQILAFSREGKSELKVMKMQVIVKEALKLIRSTIPATISIHQELQPECGAVYANPIQIHQIVMNLTTNAYHAMEDHGGELNVTLKEIELGLHDLITPDMAPGPYACLTVSDTGPGMTKENMDKAFEPFFTTKEKGKGTGMGLSVVHGIVKAMNGEIRVFSELGKGTEFQILIPIVKSSPEIHRPQTKEPVSGGSESILLVDDELGIINLERKALENLGYQVTARTSSLEALEAFRANPDKYDLVITDMAMPKMSGDRLAIELIKIKPDIPIFLCTGFSESMSEEKIQSMGIKCLLFKPIIMKELAQKIREVLDKS